MAELRFEQVQRFILVEKIFWGDGHFKVNMHISEKMQENTCKQVELDFGVN